MMRFSILDFEDAKAFSEIKAKTNIPLIADVHFDYRFALMAIDNHADKVRINPGNIQSESNLRQVIAKAKEKNIPLRIGVPTFSLWGLDMRSKTRGNLRKFQQNMSDFSGIFSFPNEFLTLF